jgi:hypothetical protein
MNVTSVTNNYLLKGTYPVTITGYFGAAPSRSKNLTFDVTVKDECRHGINANAIADLSYTIADPRYNFTVGFWTGIPEYCSDPWIYSISGHNQESLMLELNSTNL